MAVWPASLRARLTLWYSILLGIPLVVFAVTGYFIFASALTRHTDAFIEDALTAFASELQAERRVGAGLDQAMRSTVDEVRFRELHISILDSAGTVVAQSTGGPAVMPPVMEILRPVEA